MPNFRTVLFDLDGTITDSAPGITACISHAYGVLDQPVPANLRAAIGPPLSVMLRLLGLPEDLHDAFVVAYRARYVAVGMFESRVYDGVAEAITQLGAAGLRLAVATSKPEPFAILILEHFGLADRFEFIAGAEMDQLNGRGLKADVIAHCLAHLPGVSAATAVMVGDRRHDVEGALEHGVTPIGITWGYGDHAELSGAGARLIVDTPGALVAAIV